MAYVITEACIGAKERSCIEVCPVDCIYETNQMLVIDPVECIDCGACEPECPVEAIFFDDAVPSEARAFIAVNAAWKEGGAEAVDRALAEQGFGSSPPAEE
jgi:ferredoxin